MIANCDQYVDCSMDAFFESWFEAGYDGMIMTMKADDPKWSFVGFDCTGKPERLRSASMALRVRSTSSVGPTP